MLLSECELGASVEFTSAITRHTTPAKLDERYILHHKAWDTARSYERGANGGHGIIVGIRKLNNGHTEWYSDEGCNWKTDSTVQAVLIATDLRRSPVYALPENVTIKRMEQPK